MLWPSLRSGTLRSRSLLTRRRAPAPRTPESGSRGVTSDAPGAHRAGANCLLDLGARGDHHLAPLRGLGGDHLAEVLRRAGDGLAPELGQALAHLGVGQRTVHLGVDLVDYVARRALGHA